MRTATTLALLVLCTGSAHPPQDGTPSRWLEDSISRMSSAEAQLAHARRLKQRLADAPEAERAARRALAVEAYRAVRLFHPEARAVAVEAAFRAGEILRAAGADAGALEEFHWSAAHGEGTEFRARALLESGHLFRRARRWSEALEAFLAVAGDPRARAARRADAWLWAGTVWKAQGRVDEARLAWQRVSDEAPDPLARIQAFDELALLLLEADDLEGAAGMLERCTNALAARALEETEDGERVRNALLRMRIVDELPRAILRRADARAEKGSARKS